MSDIFHVCDFIRQADDLELNQMLDAITERYAVLHPGWEIAFLSWPLGDPETRKRLLEFTLKYNIDPT